MLGLNKREKKVFGVSLFLHAFGVCFLFILGLLPSCEDEPEPIHVFELAMASEPIFPAEPVPAPSPSVPLSPDKPIEAKPKPLPPSPAPPQVSTIPKPHSPDPKPRPVVKPVVENKPKPKVQPKPPSKPRVVSLAEFRKNNKLTLPKPHLAPPVVKPVVKINPSNFKLTRIQVTGTPNSSTSTVPSSVINAYLAAVKAKLERAWEKELSASTIISGGEAWLSFKITSTGQLVAKRITKSSGNRDLDRLVLSSVNSLGSVGAPPGGKLESELQIPFRLN